MRPKSSVAHTSYWSDIPLKLHEAPSALLGAWQTNPPIEGAGRFVCATENTKGGPGTPADLV